MKKFSFNFLILTILSLGILLGFTLSDNKPTDKNPTDSRKNESTTKRSVDRTKVNTTDHNGGQYQTYGVPYYTDNFDGANDTTALKNRGYKVYYRGTGPQGSTATWFQGNDIVFSAYNGPTTGYVAANYNVVTSTNDIDSWLVLPAKTVAAGDSIVFFSRDADDGGPPPVFPDSITVVYSAVGDSVPEAGSWVELGKFEVNANGVWERAAFGAPTAGANARYAIRYKVVDGGPSGSNSNYIGLDALTLENSVLLSDDVGTLSVNTPSGIILPSSPITPQATVKNFGVNTETFNVTMTITPGGYSSTQTVTSLTSGSTTNVNFANYTPTQGSYQVTVYTQLATDQNLANDTGRKAMDVVQPNYGGSGAVGYFFANSTSGASPAPSQPEFCWKDTAGSSSLVVNSVNAQTGIFTGTLDDGYWRVGNALGGKKIKFGGVEYDSFFVATNGMVGFSNNSGLTSFSPSLNSTVRPALYPLWMDMDFRNMLGGFMSNRISYKVKDGFQLIITYDRAPEYDGGSTADTTNYVSYQIVVELQNTGASASSRIMVQFADTVGGRTGAHFLQYYNTDVLNAHVIGLQTAAADQLFYRAAYPFFFYGPMFSTSPVAVEFGPDATKLDNRCGNGSLSLTALLEGPYEWSTHYNNPVSVSLRNTVSPYEIVDVDSEVLNASGNATFNFTKINASGSYYVVVTTLFGIETWSANPVAFPTDASYNFTTGTGQAFGSNMRQIGPISAFFVGDVNQDGIIDGSDASLADNDIFNFAPGYGATDVNWDSIVDGTDAQYIDNNAFNFIGVVRP